MSDLYCFLCFHCAMPLAVREVSPLTLYCPACRCEFKFALIMSNSTALTVQANDRTWGELTREGVPQAFHDAFEHEELAP